MNKYRIITNDRKYRIQKRFLWFFWVEYPTIRYGCYTPTLEFDSLYDAEDELHNLNPTGNRKWKVVKYL